MAKRHPLWSSWRKLTPLARRICLASWTLSALLCGFGLGADGGTFWSSRPFATNLASSFAAALAGIPTAIVFIRWITETQTEWRDPSVLALRMRNARDEADAALSAFVGAAKRFVREDAPPATYDQALETYLSIDGVRHSSGSDRARLPGLYSELRQKLLLIVPENLQESAASYAEMKSHWLSYNKAARSVEDIGSIGLLDAESFDLIDMSLFQALDPNLTEALKQRILSNAISDGDHSMIDSFIYEARAVRRFISAVEER